MDVRSVGLLLVASFLLGYFVLGLFAQYATGSPSATVSSSASPSTVSPGDSFTLTSSVGSTVSWSGSGWYCTDHTSYYSGTWCNASSCLPPCRFPSDLLSCSSSTPTDAWNLAYYVSDSTQAYYAGFGYSSSCTSVTPDGGGYCATCKVTEASGEQQCYIDVLLGPGTAPTTFDGFLLYPGSKITVSFDTKTVSYGSDYRYFIAICWTESSPYVPPALIQTSFTAIDTEIVGFTGYSGRYWRCTKYYFDPSTQDGVKSVYITADSSGFSRIYFSAGAECLTTSYCRGNLYWSLTNIETTKFGAGLVYQDTPSDISCSPSSQFVDSGSSGSFTCTVSSTAAPGSKTITTELYDYTPFFFFCPYTAGTYYIHLGYPELLADTDTTTVTVVKEASNVYLYEYGSNTGSPSQEPDDSFVRYRIYLDGTQFDGVDFYVDGSLVESYVSSDFTCSVSSGYCYLDDSYDMWGKASGAHTLKAVLYVDGTQRDYDQKTVYYYPVSVRNVSASAVGNQLSVSWEMSGGWEQYRIYIDSSDCVALDWTGDGPPSAHDYQLFSETVSIPSCAAYTGTHTVYVEAQDESGHSSSSSTSVYYEIVYTYSVTVDSPPDGSEIHVQSSAPGAPTGASVDTSASYATDDPSAVLKLLLNGSVVSFWSVTGSGTQSYTLTETDGLACGYDTIEWALYDSSDVQQASSSSSVTLYCWYVGVSPEGPVDVPSDGTSPLPDAEVTVYVDESVTPDVPRTVSLYWNGTDISYLLTTDCPGHSYCAHVTPSDVSFGCGDTVTLRAEQLQDSTVRAFDESVITINCVEQYAIIREPSDGAAYDVNSDTASVPPDFNILLGVDYAGGDTLEVNVNGAVVSLDPVTPCDYTVCYTVPGDYLLKGPNFIKVTLYSSGSPVYEDRVDFNVFVWTFQFTSSYSTTTGTLSVKEYGSHASSCEITMDSQTYSMLYSSATSSWDYVVYTDSDGKSFSIVCRSPTGKVVYTYSGVVDFSQAEAGGGAGGGAAVEEEAPEAPKVLPFWPDTARSGLYEWSIVDKSPFSSGIFTSAAVSSTYVCVGTDQPLKVYYCKYSMSSIPSNEDTLSEVLNSATQSGCVTSNVYPVGEFKCARNYGSGVYVFDASGNKTRILVAGGGFDYQKLIVTAVFLGIVGAVGYFLLMRGGMI